MMALKSRLYTTGKIIFDRSVGRHAYVSAPNGHLYSGGKRLFKCSETDLPEYFAPVYCYRCNGYMNAKDVKYLLYVPNYFTNHEYKDDMLYVSYKNPIIKVGASRRSFYANYDYMMSGPTIVTFAEAVKKYNPEFKDIDDMLFKMYLKPIIIGVNRGKEEIRLHYC